MASTGSSGTLGVQGFGFMVQGIRYTGPLLGTSLKVCSNQTLRGIKNGHV